MGLLQRKFIDKDIQYMQMVVSLLKRYVVYLLDF